MANWTQSISDTIDFFGIEPTTKWNEFLWGTGKWSYGNFAAPMNVGSVSPTQNEAATDGYFFNVATGIDNYGSEALTDIFTSNQAISQSESLSFSGTGLSEYLLTGNGYTYVFPGPSTDAESDNESTYTAGSRPTTTYTSGVTAGGSWS